MNIVRMIVAAFLLMLCSAASAMGFNLPKLDELERSLQLTPPQKEQYDLAVGATKRVMLSMALATIPESVRVPCTETNWLAPSGTRGTTW